MRLFFVNTDAVSYAGKSKHDDWIGRNVVLTGGDVKYKHDLARIPADARVLVYVNKLGVVAVGQILTKDVQVVLPPDTIYDSDQPEYHRPVTWLLDLRESPIGPAELIALLGWNPRLAVQEVHKGKEALLRSLAILEATPTTNADTYTRVAAELLRYGAVERPTGTAQPARTQSQGTQFSRDPRVRAWTLVRAQGHCELCHQPAPFVDMFHEPYLESHHITMLALEGADTPENTAALCANCHRELHFGAERHAKTEQLRAIVATKESSI
jgi:hypothetical protein